MPYPPGVLPTDNTDSTSSGAGHHANTLHNAVNAAVNDVVTELGTDPSGASASVTARLSALDTTVSGKSDTGHTHAGPAMSTNWSNRHVGTVAPASRAVAAANGQYWVLVEIHAEAVLTGIRYRKGAGTTAANVIAALYDSTGARVAVSNSVAQGTVASVTITVPFTAAYAAPGGRYWASIVGSATAADFLGWAAANEYLGPGSYAAQATFTAAASFTPPALNSLSSGQPMPLLVTY